jgi:hypothetical protein
MFTPHLVHDALFRHGDSLFPVGFSDYLDQTNRVVWGLLIESDANRLSCLFGDTAPADIEIFNSVAFNHSMSGYRVEARGRFPQLSANADVFLLSKQCHALPPCEVEALVIHELCHWYIDSGLQSSAPVRITSKDRLKGKSLYRKTDTEHEGLTRHTPDFCELLCAVSALAVARDASSFPSRDALVAAAMRFDVLAGIPT